MIHDISGACHLKHVLVITVFTRMQDYANLRYTTKKDTSAKGKCVYPNLRWPSKENVC
jgi:hypothetical protein